MQHRGYRLVIMFTCCALMVLRTTYGWADEAASPKKIVTVEGITEYQLDNGLRVLLFPDQSKPRVTVNLTVCVGSRHEGYGEAGMAHLLEHLLFKGTPLHPNIPQALQERGAQCNGRTSMDRSNYFETLPAGDGNLAFTIRLEADRLVNSYVKRDDLDAEMTVVRNEFERGENTPISVLNKRIMAAAYAWHNYIPAGPHPEFPALQVLGNILSTQPSGRLYKALVESHKATSVVAATRPLHDPGVLSIQAEVPRGSALDDVRDTILTVVEAIGTQGVTAEEVKRARQQILTARDLAAAETSQLAIALSEWAAQGDWRLYFLHRDRVEKVTPDDVHTVAAQYLQRNNRTVGLYMPTEKPERIAIPAPPDVQALVDNYTGRDTIAAGSQ